MARFVLGPNGELLDEASTVGGTTYHYNRNRRLRATVTKRRRKRDRMKQLVFKKSRDVKEPGKLGGQVRYSKTGKVRYDKDCVDCYHNTGPHSAEKHHENVRRRKAQLSAPRQSWGPTR